MSDVIELWTPPTDGPGAVTVWLGRDPEGRPTARASDQLRAGCAVYLRVHAHMPTRRFEAAGELYAFAVAITRHAGYVQVDGGRLDVRRSVARVIASATDATVTYAYPNTPAGVRVAERRAVNWLDDSPGAPLPPQSLTDAAARDAPRPTEAT